MGTLNTWRASLGVGTRLIDELSKRAGQPDVLKAAGNSLGRGRASKRKIQSPQGGLPARDIAARIHDGGKGCPLTASDSASPWPAIAVTAWNIPLLPLGTAELTRSHAFSCSLRLAPRAVRRAACWCLGSGYSTLVLAVLSWAAQALLAPNKEIHPCRVTFQAVYRQLCPARLSFCHRRSVQRRPARDAAIFYLLAFV